MDIPNQMIEKNRRYLELLSKQYPTIQSVCTEIINLRAILNLPKSTEHFMSDLHGEHEAFIHILNNASGVIREKVNLLYSGQLSQEEISFLCTLIYYPKEKLKQIKEEGLNTDDWYENILARLIEVCKMTGRKYTRSKLRKAMPPDYAYIIDELLHAAPEQKDLHLYYTKIRESILALDDADGFICALSNMIKRLAIDHLHIVGDVFDRGPRPDIIMDLLCEYHSVDVQWGNHDILWMGAAAGHDVCIAGVIHNCVAYNNLNVLEAGYGINLRPLALFANETYPSSPVFIPKGNENSCGSKQDLELAGKMYKAISIIMFKLEGQVLKRHPEYNMESRLLLDKIDYKKGTITIGGHTYPLLDSCFPTVSEDDPYRLTGEEKQLIDKLRESFASSPRLLKHVQFLYSHGSMYKCYNHNLLFHGCVPLNTDGSFAQVNLDGSFFKGKALFDQCNNIIKNAFYSTGDNRTKAGDNIWYLWCGRLSPLFGREKMTTFERLFIDCPKLWEENKNPYYQLINREQICCSILEDFGLGGPISHIINGHVPVRAGDGENPVKANGKLIIIDGGFCKANQSKTGIAGYTLIYNSYGMRLSAHEPFKSVYEAINRNTDIHSATTIFETMQDRMRVMDTDIGQDISEQIYDLTLLLNAYQNGRIAQKRLPDAPAE